MDIPRPAAVPDPVSSIPTQRYLDMPSYAGTVRAVSAGEQTCMLLSHTVVRWPDRMKTGLVFTMTARARSKPYSWRLWATVEVTGVCVHRHFDDIPACKAGHEPSRIEPGRQGWARIRNHAMRGNQATPEVTAERWRHPWTVVDVTCIESGRERLRTGSAPRQYRNAIEAELAEDNRYYDWLKLSAEQAGDERTPSQDEVWFRAKSAAYNRKLGMALANGDDPALLTVSDAEIKAEVPKFERRARQ